jgi:hypothetical protein
MVHQRRSLRTGERVRSFRRGGRRNRRGRRDGHALLRHHQVPRGLQPNRITHKGGAGVGNAPVNAKKSRVAAPASSGFVLSELIEMSKATGDETPKCGIKRQGSSTILSDYDACNNSALDFEKNFYYLRIVLKSGILAGQLQTVYGSSLFGRP